MKVNLDMNLFRFKKRIKKKKAAVIIQENPEECIKIIETNFPKNIFKESVTDISYNGLSFYAQDNDIGRHKLDIKMSSDEVLTFIRKIANYMLQPFSMSNPSLDVSFGDYRLNAIHPSLARTNNHKVVTFSLRKITATLKIKEILPTSVNFKALDKRFANNCFNRALSVWSSNTSTVDWKSSSTCDVDFGLYSSNNERQN